MGPGHYPNEIGPDVKDGAGRPRRARRERRRRGGGGAGGEPAGIAANMSPQWRFRRNLQYQCKFLRFRNGRPSAARAPMRAGCAGRRRRASRGRAEGRRLGCGEPTRRSRRTRSPQWRFRQNLQWWCKFLRFREGRLSASSAAAADGDRRRSRIDSGGARRYPQPKAGVMKWQTCQTQNLVGGNALVGSSPTAGKT
jgi:hypothetical protein